jgi:hypothetical protein
MSYEVYKLLHVVGVLFLFVALGGLIHGGITGTKKGSGGRRLAMATHGVALALILVAGFGLLAKLRIMADLPGWAWTKLGVWLVLGAAPALVGRAAPRAWWFVLPVLGGLAAYLAIFKPF